MEGIYIYLSTVFGLFAIFRPVSGARLPSDDQVLNVCMDGKHHETKPAARDLHGLCKQWESNTCCNNETAYHSQQAFSNLYNLNLHHCSKMSDDCVKWFSLSNCFYECSPNVGPWLRPDRSFIRNERFIHVPLCADQCLSWWNACKDELTCVDNWATDFVWKNGSNQCPEDKPCKTFAEIFHNAVDFCESVYPDDYLVFEDKSSCMLFNFAGPNPNADVARKHAERNNMSLEIVTTTTTQGQAPVTSRPTSVTPTAKPPNVTMASSHSPTSSSTTVAVVGVVFGVTLALVVIAWKMRASVRGVKCIPCFAWFSQGSAFAAHFRLPTDEQACLEHNADFDISTHRELELRL